MKLKSFVVCLIFCLIAIMGCQTVTKEGGYLIYQLEDKYHIFREGNYEGFVNSNSEAFQKVGQSKSVLWNLAFHNEEKFSFEEKKPKLGWKWSLFPLEDLGTYKREKIYYSREKAGLVIEPAGTVTGTWEKERKMNIAAIYIVTILVFLIASFFNNSRILPNQNSSQIKKKPKSSWDPIYFYLGIFVYLFLLWAIYLLIGATHSSWLLVIFLWLLLACLGYKAGNNDGFTGFLAVMLAFFLTIGMLAYFLPTGNFEFLTQYSLFLAILIFIAHFSTKVFMEKIKERWERRLRQIEEAYQE